MRKKASSPSSSAAPRPSKAAEPGGAGASQRVAAGEAAAIRPPLHPDGQRMPTYSPPIDDYLFLLHDVLRVQARADIAGFPVLEPDLTRQILEGAGAFLQGVWQPLNQ